MGCSFCETVPEGVPAESGTLLIAAPMPHTHGKLIRVARDAGFTVPPPEGNVVSVAVGDCQLPRLLDALESGVTQAEQRDCLAYFQGAGTDFTTQRLAEVTSLQTLCSRAGQDWLLELLRTERLTSHFQPIMRNGAEGLSVFAYEALARGADVEGNPVSPGAMFGTARTAQLMFQLDRAARLAAVRASQKLPRGVPLFINFNPTSIYDPAYCLASTIAAAREINREPELFVFEVVESDHIQDPERLLGILDVYRQAGFRVALDDLGAGYSSLNLLQQLYPDFVKLDMQLVRDVDTDVTRQAILDGILEMVTRLGIQVIAEGIETAAERDWLVAHGVDYLQGFLFARPGPEPVIPEV